MKKIVFLFTLLLTTLASWAIDDGVPHELAQQRSREITNVSYLLRLHIPAERAQRVTGKATVLSIGPARATSSSTSQDRSRGSLPSMGVASRRRGWSWSILSSRNVCFARVPTVLNWSLRVATPPSTAMTTISIRSLSQPMRVASSPVSTSPTSRPFSRSSSPSPRGGTMSRVPTPSILFPPTFLLCRG